MFFCSFGLLESFFINLLLVSLIVVKGVFSLCVVVVMMLLRLVSFCFCVRVICVVVRVLVMEDILDIMCWE